MCDGKGVEQPARVRDGKRTDSAQKSISELEAKRGGVLIYNSDQNISLAFLLSTVPFVILNILSTNIGYKKSRGPLSGLLTHLRVWCTWWMSGLPTSGLPTAHCTYLWSWPLILKHTCIYDVSLMRYISVTNEPTDKAIHVSMMHISMNLYLWTLAMVYVWCIYLWP